MGWEWALARLLRQDEIGLDGWSLWCCSSLVLGLQFTLVTSILTILDLHNPQWWQARRLSPHTRPPTWQKIKSMLPIVFRNYVVAFLFIYIAWNLKIAYGAQRFESAYYNTHDDHAWMRLFVDVMVGVLQLLIIHWVSQLWFWSAHRLVHSNASLFRFVHARHHIYDDPFALTAIDCSASEMILLNMPAVILPLILLQPSTTIQCIWTFLAATHVPLTHSGHAIPGAADDYHALHHKHLNCNYGSKTLDQLFNTLK